MSIDVDEFVEIFRSGDEYANRGMIERIEQTTDPEEAVPFVRELQRRNERTWEAVGYALLAFGPTATPALLDALRSPVAEPEERGECLDIIETVGDPTAFEPLLEMVSAEKDGVVRNAMVAALGRTGGERGVEPLLSALESAGLDPTTTTALVDPSPASAKGTR